MKRDRENLCAQCGQHPRFEDRVSCEGCLKKDRIQGRKKYASKKARREALAGKDELPTRKYTRRVDASPIQIQSMVNELELFIGNLKSMSASEYLEERENLIKTILLKGKTNDNN